MEKTIGTLGDNYIIDKNLGEGGSCTCMRGWNIITQKPYAIKFFKHDFDQEMIKDEVSIMKKLNHPNLVTAVETGRDTFKKHNGNEKEFEYLVMELAPAGDLFDVLLKCRRFSEPTARHFFKQIVEGLDYLHFEHSLCHLDIKLENILVDENFNVKITDFGFAKEVFGPLHYGGTKGYQSPEIVKRKAGFDG